MLQELARVGSVRGSQSSTETHIQPEREARDIEGLLKGCKHRLRVRHDICVVAGVEQQCKFVDAKVGRHVGTT
jgi:hypothetical protein